MTSIGRFYDAMVNRTLVAGAIGAVLVVIAFAWMQGRAPQPSLAPPPAAAPSAAAPPTTAPSATTRSAPVAAAPSTPTPPVATAQPPAPTAATPAPAKPSAEPPSFDVVRVDPAGNAVIAGRGAPGAEIRLLDGDQVLARATADGRGEWAIVSDKPLAPGNRTLRLSETLPGSAEAIASAGEVLLAVPERNRPAAAATAAQPLAPAAPEQGALALLVPKAGDAPARPLQVPPAPGGAPGGAGTAKQSLSLDIVEYDKDGRAALGGRAEPGQDVAVYLGDKLIGEGHAGADGTWSAKPSEPIPGGQQQLRIDALGGGKVTARLALPFQRVEIAGAASGDSYFTVLPGNSLWRIARRSYGSGLRYAVIYAANRDHIADPDRIYPGQVFRLPPAN